MSEPSNGLNNAALAELAGLLMATTSWAAMTQLSGLAAATITAAMRDYERGTLTDHLRSALSSRSVIDQAMGIIIGMQHCSPNEAFDVLRTVSQNRNIPIREVAAELVARTSSEPPS